MAQALHTLGIDRMSVTERIALVQDIWDSVAYDAGQLSLNEQEQNALHQRLAEDQANPEDTIAWEAIKAEAQARWQR